MGTNTRKRNLHDSYICRDIGLSQQQLKNKKREEEKKREIKIPEPAPSDVKSLCTGVKYIKKRDLQDALVNGRNGKPHIKLAQMQ